MASQPSDAATAIVRLHAKLGAPTVVMVGDAARALAAELPEDVHRTESLDVAAGAILLADAAIDPATLGAAPGHALAVLLIASGDVGTADAWRAGDLREAWRGPGGDGRPLQGVLLRAADERTAAMLVAGPLGLLLDPAVEPDENARRPSECRVAIVTYELVGLTRTGGIGTAYTALAHALAAAGASVDVLFTGWPSPGIDVERAVAMYAHTGIRVHLLDDAELDAYVAAHEYGRRAHAAYRWLRAREEAGEPFDVIHAPECAGHGSAVTAAKHAGEAFAATTVVIGTHGSSRWVREVNGDPFGAPGQLAVDALERRTVEQADVVVSPSAYLLDDMRARGWRLPRRTFVQQYVVPPAAAEFADRRLEAVRELVFFGRLEVRKGMVLFMDALDRLVGRVPGRDLSVTFLGRPDIIDGRPADELLAERRRRWPWRVQALTDLDQPEALAYLQGADRLAVMPSLADNLPLTVLEALGLRIPFVTTSTGGIPEMIHPDDVQRCAVPADPQALAAALLRSVEDPPNPPRFAVAPSVTREAHLRWHAALAAAPAGHRASAPPRETPPPARAVLGAEPLPSAAGEYVLLASPRHRFDDSIVARLAAAARATDSDAAVFPARRADGRVIVPVGGPPTLALFGQVLSTGSALVRRALVERIPANERELDDLLAAMAVDDGRVLVCAEPVAEETEAAPPPDPWLFSLWPTAVDLGHSGSRSEALHGSLARPLWDLPALAAGLADHLVDLRGALDRADALVLRTDGNWKAARDMLKRRDNELESVYGELQQARDALAVESLRLRALRNRRAVRAALALAGVRQRVLRR